MKMTKQQFLISSGLKGQTLDLWLEQRWLIPAETDEGPEFSDIDSARARLILQLRDGFGANDAGIDVILHLVDQIHGLRRAMDDLRSDLLKTADK